ncbi:uncharacterized protein CG3556-like isoform X2 [Amphiura filiformis]
MANITQVVWLFAITIIIGIVAQEPPISNNTNLHMICGPESSSELVLQVGESYQRAISWLLSQRTRHWGWPLKSTATAILAMQLTNDSWYSRNSEDLTTQLSVKQLEIELLAELSRAKVVDKDSSRKIRNLPNISPGMLAYYIMALNSTCHNVTDFYRNDLIDILNGNMNRFPQSNFNNYFQYGLALLALCKSGAPIRAKYIREILDGQSVNGSYRYGIDVVSMALMAMSCIRDKVPTGYRNAYEQKMQRSIDYILSNQDQETYSFGNQISTALAVQALTAAGVESNDWNCHEAVRSGILTSQEDEGHFGSQGGTIQILPLLINKNFASVKHVKPNCDIPQDEEVDKSVFPEINILLRIENGVDTSAENLTLNVVVPENSTLYEAMVLATDQHDDTFRFEATLGQWGHFMSHINGVANDGDRHHYWTILIGSERVSASTGSDRIITEDGETYIWYFKSFA